MKYHVWYTESSLKRDEETGRGNYHDKITARITEIMREHI